MEGSLCYRIVRTLQNKFMLLSRQLFWWILFCFAYVRCVYKEKPLDSGLEAYYIGNSLMQGDYLSAFYLSNSNDSTALDFFCDSSFFSKCLVFKLDTSLFIYTLCEVYQDEVFTNIIGVSDNIDEIDSIFFFNEYMNLDSFSGNFYNYIQKNNCRSDVVFKLNKNKYSRHIHSNACGLKFGHQAPIVHYFFDTLVISSPKALYAYRDSFRVMKFSQQIVFKLLSGEMEYGKDDIYMY
jgi:hypothetical protein